MFNRLFFLLGFAAICLANAPAFAKKPDFAEGGRGGQHNERPAQSGGHSSEGGHEERVAKFFSDDKAKSVRLFMEEEHRRDCPPGLAKKKNGCLPPGQAKKYAIGGMLPSGYTRPSRGLLDVLGVPPAGTFYAMVDKDVLLVSEASKKIIDAVTMLSGVQ